MSTTQKSITVILSVAYLLVALLSRTFVEWALATLGTLLFVYIILTVAYFVIQKQLHNFYDIKDTINKVLRVDNQHKSDISTGSQDDWSQWSEIDFLRAWAVFAVIAILFFSGTGLIALVQNFSVIQQTDTAVIDMPPLQIITITSVSESSAYLMTVTPSSTIASNAIVVLTPTPTITPLQIITVAYDPESSSYLATVTPPSTPAPTPIAVLTPLAIDLMPTPTLVLSEREKNGLPSIVILGFVALENGVQPKLLLANFSYTIGMANWKLYFNQQVICSFGEYIFWPDTVLELDVIGSHEPKSVDDQLIKCKQLNEELFSRPVIITLEDYLGFEVDRYVYEQNTMRSVRVVK